MRAWRGQMGLDSKVMHILAPQSKPPPPINNNLGEELTADKAESLAVTDSLIVHRVGLHQVEERALPRAALFRKQRVVWKRAICAPGHPASNEDLSVLFTDLSRLESPLQQTNVDHDGVTIDAGLNQKIDIAAGGDAATEATSQRQP